MDYYKATVSSGLNRAAAQMNHSKWDSTHKKDLYNLKSNKILTWMGKGHKVPPLAKEPLVIDN